MTKKSDIYKRMYKISERDGLTEVFTGIFFFFYVSLIEKVLGYSDNKIFIFIIFFAFSAPIIQKIRKHYTYSKTGYVKVKYEITKPFLFFVVFPIAFFPMIMAILFNVFNLNDIVYFMMYISPVLFSVLFFFYYFNQYKTGAGNHYLFMGVSVSIIGFFFFVFNGTLHNKGLFFFFYVNGIFLLVFGIWKFIRMIKEKNINEE